MTFGRPVALWLLALAVPIILAHLYRGRIRLLQVPALFLWEQVLPADDIRSGFRRLRHLAGLLIALAALIALTSALADPTVRGITRDPRRFVLVIDTSRQMTAERLTEARSRAREFFSRLGRRDSAAIVDGGGLVEPATEDADQRARALDRLPRGRSALEPAALLEEARAANPGASIVVLSSRPWPAGDFSLIPVGSPQPNVALVDARLEREASHQVARGSVLNLSDGAVDAILEIRNRGNLLRLETMKLAPRERRDVAFALNPAAWPGERFDLGAKLDLRLRSRDPRPEDDAAGFVVAGAAPVMVVVVSASDPDPHLLAALDLLDGAKIIRFESIRPAGLEMTRSRFGKGAVYIFDRVAPPKPLSDGGYLVVGAEGPAAKARVVDAVKIVDWDRDAPVHRFVDYTDVKASRAWILKGDPLVTSDRGPVAVWSRRQGLAWIQFGFSFGVETGDFALTPSFPVFLRHAILWLSDEGRRAFPRSARAGDVLSNDAPLADPDAELKLTLAHGELANLASSLAPGGEARIPLDKPGLLKIEAGSQEEWVGIVGAEPVDLTQLPKAAGPGLPEPIPWWRDLPWPVVVAAIVLALLALEWVLYQRGKI